MMPKLHLPLATLIVSITLINIARAEEFTFRDGGIERSFELSLDEIVISKASGRRVFTSIPKVADRAGLAVAASRRTKATGETVEFVLHQIEGGVRVGDPRVVTREILIHTQPGIDVQALVQNAGGISARKVDEIADHWIVTANDSTAALDLVIALRQDKRIISVDPLLARQQKKKLVPNDPLFNKQWHLLNTGQSNGVVGIDVRTTNVWDTYRGSNVYIAIIDDGLQTAHPDLAPNVDTTIDYDINYNDGDPSPDLSADNHGTSCAGVAAARGNNGLGVSGSAPEARLVGLRLISDLATDAQEAQAINWSNSIIQIKSNSWGPKDDGITLEGPGTLTAAALSNTCAVGRSGRGSLVFWAGGNGLESSDDSNLDGYANSIYTISVAAGDIRGRQAWYSEPGANHVICAPSNGDNNSLQEVGIMTVDRTNSAGYASGDYTGDFGGTSSACPLAAGVGALMIEANPDLGWRDVQEILIRTATRNYPADSDWRANGAGIWFNHKFGGGMINASGAVARALTWTNLGPQVIVSTNQSGYTAAIPDNNAAGITRTFTVSENIRLEHVVANVNINHARRRNLRIELISPANTTSVLAYADSSLTSGSNFPNWSFMTVRNWGELAAGTWTLKIADGINGTTGTNTSARLTLYGTAFAVSNAPPALNPISAKTVAVGSNLVFSVIAADPVDGDTITLSASGLPSGAMFNTIQGTGGITNTFTWNNASPTGTYNVTFAAADKDGTNTETVAITVFTPPPSAPASVWASVTNATDFTAAWTPVIGATGYLLDVSTNPGFAATGASAPDLFISEYVEGSGNNKYIEIFNGTGNNVNLANYRLILFSNGSTSPSASISLSGTLAANSVYVIENSSETLGVSADIANNTVMVFNGDDALALSNITASAYADIFGRIGEDPGTAWSNSTHSTLDRTLVRKSSVTVGVTANPASGFPTLSPEWDVYSVDTISNMGTHVFDGGSSPSFLPGYSNLAVSATSQLVSGLTPGATYYFRVRALNSGGISSNSATASVTTVLTDTPPSFGANPGPVSAVVGVQTSFTVIASGFPAPVLSLESQTASSGYTFNLGVLTYTPPPGDVGARTFTFSASNSLGVATQIVSVSVSAAPPTVPLAPAAIWASVTNANDFTANWSDVGNADSYRLDVGTNSLFSSGGSSSLTVLASNAASSIASLTGAFWQVSMIYSSTTFIIMTNSTSEIRSAPFSTVGITNLTVDFLARTYGGGSKSNITISISFDNGSSWSTMGVVAPRTTSLANMPTVTNVIASGSSQTRIRWQSLDAGGAGVGVNSLTIKGWSQGSSPSFVPGYEDRTVAGTSQSVTGLTEGVAYYFRARAVNAAGTSPNSPTGSVVTAASSGGGDSNSDGIPDDWFAGFGLSPTNSATNTVSGQDYTYMDAYIHDINPTNPPANFNEVPQMQPGPSATMGLSVNPSSTGRVYDVYWRTDLSGTNWTGFGLNVRGTGGEVTLTVTNEPALRYYRTGVKMP